MTSEQPDASEGQIIPFATVLQQIGRGSAHEELSTELQRLVRAVTETDKKGTLTLTLSVGPMKGSDALTVETKIVTKVPTEPRASVFFSDDLGNLTRNDPRQLELPGLREVGPTGKATA